MCSIWKSAIKCFTGSSNTSPKTTSDETEGIPQLKRRKINASTKELNLSDYFKEKKYQTSTVCDKGVNVVTEYYRTPAHGMQSVQMKTRKRVETPGANNFFL